MSEFNLDAIDGDSDAIRDNEQSLLSGRLNLPKKEERKSAELKSRALNEDIMRHDMPS